MPAQTSPARRAVALVGTALALAAASIVALAACAGPAPESSVPPTSTPSPTAVAPEVEPPATDVPAPSGLGLAPVANAVALEPGDCPFDPAAFGAVLFTVTADDDTTPIDVTFTAFRSDGTLEVRTVQAVGPLVTVMQDDCMAAPASAPWTFTATSATGGSLACAAFYGGKHLKSASDYAEGDVARGTNVDCSSHPGM